MQKLLNLLDLAKTQTFHIYKMEKIVVINKYKNFILEIF